MCRPHDWPDSRVVHAVQRRAQCVGQVLLGYLEVPAALDQQLSFVVNPRVGRRATTSACGTPATSARSW